MDAKLKRLGHIPIINIISGILRFSLGLWLIYVVFYTPENVGDGSHGVTPSTIVIFLLTFVITLMGASQLSILVESESIIRLTKSLLDTLSALSRFLFDEFVQ